MPFDALPLRNNHIRQHILHVADKIEAVERCLIYVFANQVVGLPIPRSTDYDEQSKRQSSPNECDTI